MYKFLKIAAREGLFVAILFVLFATLAGEWEGYFFPVVKDVQVEEIEPVGALAVDLSGSFTKQRNCNFQRMEWRLGTPKNSALLDIKFLEPAKVRGSGRYEWGPWRLSVDVGRFEKTFAQVYHRCHPFYETVTHFFPQQYNLEQWALDG